MADPQRDDHDPLLLNKIFGAILAMLAIVISLALLPSTFAQVFSGHHDDHGELHLAYCCVDLEAAKADGGAGAEPEMDLGEMMANSNAAAGERTAALCGSCHSFEKGGANGTGPNLWDVVGRDVASVSGFGYSNALQEFGGEWTYERLDGYLANSQAYVPGTTMVQRFPQADKRANILAYLGSLSDDPAPFPEPAPEEGSLAEPSVDTPDEIPNPTNTDEDPEEAEDDAPNSPNPNE